MQRDFVMRLGQTGVFCAAALLFCGVARAQDAPPQNAAPQGNVVGGVFAAPQQASGPTGSVTGTVIAQDLSLIHI